MSTIELTIESGQGAAVADEPLIVALDEANGINWNAAAEAFVDDIVSTDIAASVGGVNCASWEEVIDQTPGSRKVVLHVNMPTCADGTVLRLESGGGTTRDPTGVPGSSHVLYSPMAALGTQENLAIPTITGAQTGSPSLVSGALGNAIAMGDNDWYQWADPGGELYTAGDRSVRSIAEGDGFTEQSVAAHADVTRTRRALATRCRTDGSSFPAALSARRHHCGLTACTTRTP